MIAYYPDVFAPRCDGERAEPGDADYCGPQNFVAFDEPGFMVPFYRSIGPVANATILAHEWGHLVQGRLGLDYARTVEKELNADCLAGAWAAAAIADGYLESSELAQAKRQLIAVGDAPGVSWHAATAHGSGDQRVAAFELGEQQDATACLRELAPGFSRGKPGVVP